MGNESIKYRGSFRRIKQGENVKPSIANRPPSDLLGDIQYLKSRLDLIEAGQALTLTDQVLNENLPIGTPVYLNSSGVWAAAKAEVAATTTSTIYSLTAKAHVQGVVSAKTTGTVANITLYGAFTTDSTILDVIEGDYASGLYYLSSFEDGFITASQGAVPVRVCLINGPDADGNYTVLVTPDARETAEGHGHYRVQLTASPAGLASCVPIQESEHLWGEYEDDGPYPGTLHAIALPDSNQAGWLPANDATFDDKEVPAGAKFGYNIAQDSSLSGLWPPTPLSHVYIEIDGVGAGPLVEVNSDGIWWMDDTYGQAPWSVNSQPCGSSSSSSSLSSDIPDLTPEIILWFTRPVYGSVYENLQDFVNGQIVWDNLIPSGWGDTRTSNSSDDLDSLLSDDIFTFKLRSGETGRSWWYVLSLRDYYPLQPVRAVKLHFELLLGNYSDAQTETAERVLSCLQLDVSTIKPPALGSYKDLNTADGEEDTLYPVTIDWNTYPSAANPVVVGGVTYDQKPDTYYRVSSDPITVTTASQLHTTLKWNDTLTLAHNIRFLGFRVVTELVESND